MGRKLFAGLIILLLIPAILVQAQTPSQTFTSADGSFTFQYPEGWYVETVNADMGPEHTSFVVNNLPLDKRFDSPEGVSIQISFPQKRAAFAVMGGGATPAEILQASATLPGLPAATAAANAPARANDKSVTQFTVNGFPAARVIVQNTAMGLDVSLMSVILDVGNDYLVSATATSLKGGFSTIKNNEQAIVSIVETIRYAPKVIKSANPDLPQVYSGLVGIWQAGTIQFSYPAGWVVYTNGTQVIQNVTEPVATNAPKSGQMVAIIQGPSETRSSVDPNELGDQCNSRKSSWTARQIVEKFLTFNAGQIQQLKDQGISISKPVAVTLNGKDIVYFYQFQGDLETLIIFTDLGSGNVPVLSAIARRGEMKNFEKQLLAIAGTFEYTPKPCFVTVTPATTKASYAVYRTKPRRSQTCAQNCRCVF